MTSFTHDPVINSKAMKESLNHIKQFSRSPKMNNIIQNINFKRKQTKFMTQVAAILRLVCKADVVSNESNLHCLFKFNLQSKNSINN